MQRLRNRNPTGGKKYTKPVNSIHGIDHPPSSFDALGSIYAQRAEHLGESAGPDEALGQARVTVGDRKQPDTPGDHSVYPRDDMVSRIVEWIAVHVAALVPSERRPSPIVVQHSGAEFPDLFQPVGS
jgi:hypothetical protein